MTTPAASAARSLSAAARSRLRACRITSWPSLMRAPASAAAESVGGAGDEDTGHGIILPSGRARRLTPAAIRNGARYLGSSYVANLAIKTAAPVAGRRAARTP